MWTNGYRILLDGHWMSSRPTFSDTAVSGFYASRLIREEQSEAAEVLALELVLDELRRMGMPTETLQVAVEQCTRERIAFWKRRGEGFSFYSGDGG